MPNQFKKSQTQTSISSTYTSSSKNEIDFIGVFEQAPAFMATLRGKNHVFELANKAYFQLVGHRDIIGKPVLEALPEVENQGFTEFLDDVLKTGKPYIGTEVEIFLQKTSTSQPEKTYVNFIYQPLRNESDEINGILVHGIDVTEQVLAREKIKESEEEYRILFNSIDQGFCIIEMIFDKKNKPVDYKFLEVNKVFEEQTGLVNPTGKTALELLPNLESHWFETYGQVALTGKPLRFMNGSDVMKRWFDVFATQVGGKKSRKVALLFRDITAQRAREKELIESEEYFRQMADTVPIVIWITDVIGNCTYMNKQWYEHTCQKKKAALKSGWLDATHPDDVLHVKKTFQTATKNHKPFSVEYRLQAKDGSYRWVIDSGSPKFDNDGNFEGLIGTVIDIHARKLTEEALQKNELHLHAMINQAMVGIAQADLNGKYTFVNDRYAEIVGRDKAEFLNLNKRDIAHRDDLQHNLELIKKSIEDGTDFVIEKCHVRPDKKDVWVSNHVSLIRDRFGKSQSMLVVSVDITDRKNLEEQKDNFLGIASHELKTPVTSIKAYCQVLEMMFRKRGDIKAADQLKKMDLQVDKLTYLIGDLLDVTKIQAGKLQLVEEYFDFNELVNEVSEEIQRTTDTHKIIKKLSISKSIFCDRERTAQVITNFMTNAIKYSPEADKIIVSTKVKKSEVILSVQDFGVGIPKGKQDKVFLQFFRVSGSKQDTFPGLGLGLFISSDIIKREGGKIWVESDEGKGSTFYFSLPIKKIPN